MDSPNLLSLAGRCFLKSHVALTSRVRSHGFAVSGERLCAYFGEGLSAEKAQARQGFSTIPWRTVSSMTDLDAWSNYIVLPAAGSSQWYMSAAAAVDRLGFVAILDALDASQVAEFREGARHVADKMLSIDALRLGNRGPRRYSYGGASRTGHLMHLPPWPKLLDIEPASQVLKAIFPTGYLAAGGGGDFVLGNTSTYQSLHLDIGGGPIYDTGPPPAVAVNFVVEDLTCADGPLRVVPGSHRWHDSPPALPAEPQHMKEVVLCPLPAGTAIVRDLRAWHGGTPNGSFRTRYLPNAEFVSAAWASIVCGSGQLLDPCRSVLPKTLHDDLSPHARAISAGMVEPSGVLHASVATGEWLVPDFPEMYRHSLEFF